MPSFLEWQNIIFTAPLVAGVLYMLLMMVGIDPIGADADMDVDVDADFDADTDYDAAGAEHFDVDLGHDHQVEADHDILKSALSFFGVGRVPLSILFITWSFLWGVTGFWANRFFETLFHVPFLYFWPSLGVAIFISGVGTRLGAGLLAGLLPKTTSHGATKKSLVGKSATVLHQVSEASGTVRLRDQFGNLQDLPSRSESGVGTLAEGESVLLTRYNEEEQLFLVRPNPLS